MEMREDSIKYPQITHGFETGGHQMRRGPSSACQTACDSIDRGMEVKSFNLRSRDLRGAAPFCERNPIRVRCLQWPYFAKTESIPYLAKIALMVPFAFSFFERCIHFPKKWVAPPERLMGVLWETSASGT
jgi:hypothetical protein